MKPFLQMMHACLNQLSFPWLLCSWLWLALAGPALALDTVSITAEAPKIAINRQMDYTFDKTLSFGLEQVQVKPLLWKQINSDDVAFGFDSTPLWLRFKIANLQPDPQHLILQTSYPLLDHLDVYLLKNSKEYAHIPLGDALPFDSRPLLHHHFLVPIVVAGDSEIMLYMRVQTEGALKVPITLWDQTYFYQHQYHFTTWQGFFFGILAIMALYNLFVYFGIRDTNYLWYSAYVALTAIVTGCLNGTAFLYLWPGLPALNAYILPVAIGLLGLSRNIFTLNLLQLRGHYKKLYIFYWIIAALYGLMVPTALFASYHFSITLIAVLAASSSAIGMATGFYLVLQGHRTAWIFTLSWIGVLTANIVNVLNKADFIASGWWLDHALELGAIIQIVLLSFALSSRFRQEREAKEFAQQKALLNEQRLRLEEQRYLELEYNSRLEELDAHQKVLKAEADNRAKSEFLATMSHEIRTPMNGVLGMTELLQDTELKEQQRQYLDVISSSGTALLNIINDILDYSKIAAGKMELEQIDFDLDKLCLDCTSVFSVTAERKRLEVVCSLEPGTPVFIHGDPARLRQILLNLLGNAFKFTNEGMVSLRVLEVAEPVPTPGEHLLRFEIRDSGIGISDAAIGSLFHPFTQADAAINRQFGGTGLGLSISRHLAELMGGEIGVNAKLNEGSTFWFTMRCSSAAATFTAQHEVPLSVLQGRKILIVDDFPDFTQVIKEQAESWGMRPYVAYFGAQALDLMTDAAEAGDPFELVTLDMSMPGMSGLECAEKIQANSRLKSCQCILLTAMRNIPQKEALQRAGIRLAIQKPASARILRQTLLELLEGHHLRPLPRHNNMIHNPLRGQRVLVAEDNVINQMVITGMLEKLEISVVLVDDGQKALNFLRNNIGAIDLVLMDCDMPEMDGNTAIRHYRAFEQEACLPALPLIVVTAHALPEQQATLRESGADFLLIKPIDIISLRSALMDQLKLSLLAGVNPA